MPKEDLGDDPAETQQSSKPSSQAKGFKLPRWAESVFMNTKGKHIPCLEKKWRDNLPQEFSQASLARLNQGLCVKRFSEEGTIHYHHSNGNIVATHEGMVLFTCANSQCRLTKFGGANMQWVNKYSVYTAAEGEEAGSFTFSYDPKCITWILLTKKAYESIKAGGDAKE
jgi:hypothetical protein